MRTVQEKIYKFEELEETIQEKIISRWRDNDYYHEADENIGTINKLEKIFSISVDFSYGGNNSYIRFSGNLDAEETAKDFFLSYYSLREWKDFSENCKLTGYYTDSCLSPIIETIESDIGEIEETIQEVLDNWLTICEKDFDYWLSEEDIREEIKANEYEFYENGKLF